MIKGAILVFVSWRVGASVRSEAKGRDWACKEDLAEAVIESASDLWDH